MLKTDTNQISTFNARRLEIPRELVGTAIKLRVTKLIVSKNSGDGIRLSFSTRFKQLVNASVLRELRRGPIPLLQRLGLFILTQQSQFGEALLGFSHNAFQETP